MDKQTQMKVWYRKEICDKHDWRIKHIWNLESELEKVPGNDKTFDWEVWSIFVASEQFIFDRKRIGLTKPEMTAVYINISNNHFQESRKMLFWIKKDNTWFYYFEWNWFDLLENIIVSTVFAVSALEVFFNQFLINSNDNDILVTTLNKEWKKIWLLKKDLEWLWIEEKILVILPLIFKTQNSDMQKISSKLKQLNKLRNRIIHLKSIDIKNTTDIKTPSTIRKQLFDQTKDNPAFISKEIIKFFYDQSKNEYPRWLRLLPFKK